VHIRIAVAAGLVALSTWSLSGQAGRNPIGYCVGLKGLEVAKAAGFDYVELGTTEAIFSETPAERRTYEYVRGIFG